MARRRVVKQSFLSVLLALLVISTIPVVGVVFGDESNLPTNQEADGTYAGSGEGTEATGDNADSAGEAVETEAADIGVLDDGAQADESSSGYQLLDNVSNKVTYSVTLWYYQSGLGEYTQIDDMDNFVFPNDSESHQYQVRVVWQALEGYSLGLGDFFYIPIKFTGAEVLFGSASPIVFDLADNTEAGRVTYSHADEQGNPIAGSLTSDPGESYVAIAEFTQDISGNNNYAGNFNLTFQFTPIADEGPGEFTWAVGDTEVSGTTTPPDETVVGDPWTIKKDINKKMTLDSGSALIYNAVQINEKERAFDTEANSVIIRDVQSTSLTIANLYARHPYNGSFDTSCPIMVDQSLGYYGSSLEQTDGQAYFRLFSIDWEKA
ncbi:MAG: hypothetical protein LBR39_04335, partial [Coriobacteriales bacterium]|nr:hypothetical protein [Coriobacteriales bacterium]